MRIIMAMKWDGVTPDQYDQMTKSLDMDNNHPKGLVFHVTGFTNNAIRVTDVWESADDFNNYAQHHIMAAAAEAKIEGQPQVEIFPVHAMWTPNAAV